NNPQLWSLLEVLEPLAYLGLAYLITLAIQQDPIPGVRQDWLVRPIRRRDLLFAKLIFVLLMVQVSMLAGDVFQGLANGFSFRQSLAPALARNVVVLLFLTLPLFAVASFTRTLAEATVWIVMGMLAAGGGQILISGLLRNGPGPARMIDPSSFTGAEWVGQCLRMMVLLLGAGTVVGLQYFRRKTMPSRYLTGCIAAVLLLTELLPWRVVFAVQQHLSTSPGAGQVVNIAFDPGVGRAQRPPGLDANDFVDRIRVSQGSAIVLLPLNISGLPDDSVLRADRTYLRLTTSEGKVVRLDSRDDFRLLHEGHSNGESRAHPEIRMKQELYEQLRNQTVALDIEYSLTLFRLSGAYALPALGGDGEFPEFGRCATTMDDEKDDVMLRCKIPGRYSGCISGFLEHIPSGRRNPELFFCSADYAPYPLTIVPDMMGGGRVGLPFRDLNGLAHYPVDGNQLPQSRVVLRAYNPVDHFTRHLVIPQIKLSDWEPQ
ncbi:MAG TPA: hypothetical protein VI685_09620, partial [Candidatus Angelobacter sp.]